MRRILFAAAAAATLALGACETATPYQPLHAPGATVSGGYFEHQIEANRWQVGFAGNSLTSRPTVERYLLRRAAELTLQQGFDWFAADQRHTDKKTETYGYADPYFAGYGGYGGFGGFWGPRWGFYRPGFGWNYGYWGDPFFGGPLDVQQTSKFQATAEIVMGHGKKPADRQAFDARQVVEHIQVTPPKS